MALGKTNKQTNTREEVNKYTDLNIVFQRMLQETVLFKAATTSTSTRNKVLLQIDDGVHTKHCEEKQRIQQA